MIARALLLCLGLSLAAQTRTISFSGYTWQVKNSGKQKWGPGPNLFSDSSSNVWVDNLGKLHMKIDKDGNRWTCAEVILTESKGYGTYRFYLDTAVDNFDPTVVLGLFTWNDDPAYAHREIDIEFARWGNAGDPTNAQYVVQPYDLAPNLVRWTEPASAPQSVHSLEWRSNSVTGRSVRGTDPVNGQLINQYVFSAPTVAIPVPGGENARINLWLYQGRAPKAKQPIEVVISKFEYLP